MFNLFKRQPWSLDGLTPPWSTETSIYEHLRTNSTAQLPDEAALRKKHRIGWVDGAMDGVFGHHAAKGDRSREVLAIAEALRILIHDATENNLHKFYELLL